MLFRSAKCHDAVNYPRSNVLLIFSNDVLLTCPPEVTLWSLSLLALLTTSTL